ncbi:MAG TPA: ABC transporter permease [Bacteroidia bacterium]|nr:ABC transporter permease [Bacteroidia bacterium]
MKSKNAYLLYFLVYKNLQLKYKHSLLGFVWSFLHPLLYLLIFTFVFSKVFNSIPHYPLFVLSGLVFWIYFSASCNQLCQTFIRNAHMIKSLSVNKLYYAVSEQGAELINFMIGLIVFAVLMFFLGLQINWTLLYLIPIVIMFTFFTFSFGVILGSLNVFFRDIGILWGTLNPALFYLTPIAYSSATIPTKFLFIYKLNPLYHFYYIIRNVLYEGRSPEIKYVLYCLCICLITFGMAVLVYRKTRNGFISNL